MTIPSTIIGDDAAKGSFGFSFFRRGLRGFQAGRLDKGPGILGGLELAQEFGGLCRHFVRQAKLGQPAQIR